MVDNKDGTFNCSYKPLAGSKHTVQVSGSIFKLEGLFMSEFSVFRSTTEEFPPRTALSGFSWPNRPMPVTCSCSDLEWRRESSPMHPPISTSTADRQDQVKLHSSFQQTFFGCKNSGKINVLTEVRKYYRHFQWVLFQKLLPGGDSQ
jgi:hypothetical protein